MPGQKTIKSDSWAWFRAELVRRLGQDEADALWTELSRRRRVEQTVAQRKRAARQVAFFESQLTERQAQGRATARIEQSLARWRALLEDTTE